MALLARLLLSELNGVCGLEVQLKCLGAGKIKRVITVSHIMFDSGRCRAEAAWPNLWTCLGGIATEGMINELHCY